MEVNLDLAKMRVLGTYLIIFNCIVFMIGISPSLNTIHPSG